MLDPSRPITLEDLGVNPLAPLPMTTRQESTVIAALRLWQAVIDGKVDLAPAPSGPTTIDFTEIANCLGIFEPLTSAEVDDLLATVFRVV